jgi:MFS transporter, DHA1 family, inner membrane transport protein
MFGHHRVIPLAAATFAVGTDSFVVAGVLPQVATSLDVGVGAAGQLVTAYALAYAAAAPLLAAATARWPRRRVLMSGLAVFVAGNGVTVATGVFAVALVGRVLAGAGGAMVTPVAVATAAMLVPEARRGRALALVTAGLSVATALGVPAGTVVGAVLGWRATLLLVAAVGLLAMLGVAAAVPPLPAPQAVPLARRFAPVADRRVALVLATTFATFAGLYTVYSYISVVFARATGGSGSTLALLLFAWGVAATVGNASAGVLTDRYGDRRVLNAALALVAVDFALLPWTSRDLPAALAAIIIWGACGWAVLVPNIHRLLGTIPAQATLLTALHSTVLYASAGSAAALGAAGTALLGTAGLGPLGACLIGVGLLAAERAHRAIRAVREQPPMAPGSPVRETRPASRLADGGR